MPHKQPVGSYRYRTGGTPHAVLKTPLMLCSLSTQNSCRKNSPNFLDDGAAAARLAARSASLYLAGSWVYQYRRCQMNFLILMIVSHK